MAEVNHVQMVISSAAELLHDMASDVELCGTTLEIVNVCVGALRAKRKIILCGNGGSAADAQHWAGELVSRFAYDRPGLAAIALTTDTSILTAVGNDYGYEQVFSRQLESIGLAGDVLLAISTSGNSPNIIKALESARAMGISTIGFTGKSGGRMSKLCDMCVYIPHSSTPRIQEGHEVLGHIICCLIEEEMFPKGQIQC